MFAVSFMPPLPLYVSTCGYPHGGRVNTAIPSFTSDEGIRVVPQLVCDNSCRGCSTTQCLPRVGNAQYDSPTTDI
jgi:hypothetical protein